MVEKTCCNCIAKSAQVLSLGGSHHEMAVSEKSNQGRFNDMKKRSSLEGDFPPNS